MTNNLESHCVNIYIYIYICFVFVHFRYQITQKCWQRNANSRPTFDELTLLLEALLQVESDYMELELYQEDQYIDLDSEANPDEKV